MVRPNSKSLIVTHLAARCPECAADTVCSHERATCEFCDGKTDAGCLHREPAAKSKRAIHGAYAHLDELARVGRGRPSTKSPHVGIKRDDLAAEIDVSESLLSEAIYVVEQLRATDPERLDRMLAADAPDLGAVYDDLRSAKKERDTANRDRRFTSAPIRDAVHEVYGGDFRDAASELASDGSNPMHAPRIYTESDDGLSQPWAPKTWCNPPFSRKADFFAKAACEASAGHASYVVSPDDTSTIAFHSALAACVDMLYFVGRPKYGSPVGASEDSPNFGTVIFGFGQSCSPLAAALRKRGIKCTVVPSAATYAALSARLAELEQIVAGDGAGDGSIA
jgi:hypothetical protein